MDAKPLRVWTRRSLELIGLSSFAIAQPALDVLGRHATFFVAQGAELSGIIVLVLLLVFAIPLAVITIELLVSLVSWRATLVIHVAFVSILFALAVVPALGRTFGATPLVWVVLAGAFLAIATVAYLRFARFRQFLSWTALGSIVFVAAFLFFSPVRELIIAGHEPVSVGKSRSEVPVVILILDELQLGSLMTPEGEIDAARFPSFAGLASRSTWYPNATTNGETTRWAIPALLTGRWVASENKTPTSGNFPANLFSFVDGSQRIYASEFVTRLCPSKVCERVGADPGLRSLLLDAGMVYLHVTLPPEIGELLLPPLTGKWKGFAAVPEAVTPQAAGERDENRGRREFVGWLERDIRSDQVDRFEAMTSHITKKNAPALWYLHVGLPHTPWRFLPTKQAFETERRRLPAFNDDRWIDSQAIVDHSFQRYLLQLRFTDRLLGELVESLEHEGLYNSSLLIVASDHGVSFRPDRSRRRIDSENAADLLPVPLFVKMPGQDHGQVDRRNAELIDVLPTILEVLGIDADSELHGSSLIGPDPRRGTKRVFSARSGPHVYDETIDGIEGVAKRVSDLFGRGGLPDDLYAMGPHRHMMGVAAGSYTRSMADRPARVTIQEPELFDSVDPDGPFIPALVRGYISGQPAGEPVAVSLNGKIAGLGRTFKNEGRVRLYVIVSPRYFRPGKNNLEVFRILPGEKLEALPLAN